MELAASSVKFSLVLSAGMASLYPSASSSELWCLRFDVLLKKFLLSGVPTLGMTYPAAPETVYLRQPQQPPTASRKDMCCGAKKWNKSPTIAITPLTLKGDMIMFPGSSLSCWYSRLPNTCKDKYGVDTRVWCVLQIIYRVPAKEPIQTWYLSLAEPAAQVLRNFP